MQQRNRWTAAEAADKASDRQTASLAAAAFVLALLVGGVFLVQQLRAAASLQDCLMSGRSNCATMASDGRR